jgi:phosphoglycerate dehydrogenase-like enzyme
MRVLMCSPDLAAITEVLREALPAHEIVPTEPDALAAEAPGAEVIIPARTPISAATIASASRLRLIQQFGIGVDHVDLEAARARGIPVANAPAGPSGIGKAVAEFALMHLIAAGRQLPSHFRAVAAQSIAVPFGASLFDARVCIVGVGGIGSEIARLLKPFGATLIGVKRTPDPDLARDLGLAELFTADRLTDAVRDCGFVVLAVPLTDETHGLVDRSVLDALPDGSVLVNVSRGPVVERQPLLDALDSGRLRAAGLDVFWEEPVDPADSVLEREVFATPHAASACDIFLRGTSDVVRENISRIEAGKPLEYRVA